MLHKLYKDLHEIAVQNPAGVAAAVDVAPASSLTVDPGLSTPEPEAPETETLAESK